LVSEAFDGHVEDGGLAAAPWTSEPYHIAPGGRGGQDLGGQRLCEGAAAEAVLFERADRRVPLLHHFVLDADGLIGVAHGVLLARAALRARLIWASNVLRATPSTRAISPEV
jgi:hypothetical protein